MDRSAHMCRITRRMIHHEPNNILGVTWLRMRYSGMLLAGALVLTGAAAMPAGVKESEPSSVPLRIEEPSGVARKAWPVTSGVPFAKGLLADPANALLVDEAGKPVPADIRVTSRWRDNSVMWLLLDFQVDLDPGQIKTFRLLYGPTVKSPKPVARGAAAVTVSETVEAISVSTGALIARISKVAFSLPEAITLADGTQALKSPGRMYLDVDHLLGPPQEENWLRKLDHTERTERFDPRLSKKPFTASVEWQGTMRTVVRLEGWHGSAAGRDEYPYVVRLTFYAGKPWIEIMHTVVFTGDVKRDFIRRMAVEHELVIRRAGVVERSVSFIRRMAVEHKLALPEKGAIVFGGSSPHEMPAGTGWASLLETGMSVLRHKVPYTEVKPVAYVVDAGTSAAQSARVASGEWAKGWATLRGGKRAASVAIRYFDKLFPKEIAVDAASGTITQYLWADRGEQVLDLRRRYDYVDNKTHYDLGMWPKGGRGAAKTHQMLMWFGDGSENAREADAIAGAFAKRLFALAPPEWYGTCDVWPRFHQRDPQRFPRLEAIMDLAMEWRLRNVSQFGWYGFIDFGDTLFLGYELPCHSGESGPKSWASRGYVGWLNGEGLDRVNLVHYLRSGDRRLFDYWEAMVRHITDLDTCHYDENQGCVGGGHRHDQQHWGNKLVGYGTATFGAMDMYLLLGDLRCLDVAKENANFHRRGGGDEDEYVGEYLVRLAAVTGDAALYEEARKEVRNDSYGFLRTGNPGDGTLDQPHFRCSLIQHPSLITYLSYVDDPEMRERWVNVARQRAMNLELDLGALQFGYAYRYAKDPIFLDALKINYSMLGPYVKPRVQEFFPDKVFPKPPCEMSFDELAATAKGCVNNIYNDYWLAGMFPYLISIAVEAGLTEADLLAHPPRLKTGGVAWDWGWAGEPVKELDRAHVRTLDLRPAANANPWSELRTYGAPLQVIPPVAGDALRFSFLTACGEEVEPGCYPVWLPSVYPVTFRSDYTVREEGSYVYGLPWGGRIELAGIPFDLIHPSAKETNGKTVIVLHDNESATIPVRVKGKRLFLLLTADNSPYDHTIGARLSLRYSDGKSDTQDLANLEHYENWRFWGFAKTAHFARAFKISSQWDGRTTLLNVLEVPLRDLPLESVELADAGKKHRLAILAVSMQTEEATAAHAAPVLCDLIKKTPEGEGWIEGKDNVKPGGGEVMLAGSVTYRVKVPPGSYRVDAELMGRADSLAEILIGGAPAATPWTLSKGNIAADGSAWERVSVWGRAGNDGLDITIQTAPGKGLWRHYVVHNRILRLRYLAVTAEDAPPHVPPPVPVIRFGWSEMPAYPWKNVEVGNVGWVDKRGVAENAMIIATNKAKFKVALAPGQYQLKLVAPSLVSADRRVGRVNPGPANITLQDGKTFVLPQPEEGCKSRIDVKTTVGQEGLTITFEQAKDAQWWGLALLEIRKQ